MSVYVLTQGKRAEDRLVPSEETIRSSASIGSSRIRLTNCRLSSLATQLERRLGRPVIDETDLGGGFDFDLLWNESFPKAVFGELRSKYGLVVHSEWRDMHLLVVERADAGNENSQL